MKYYKKKFSKCLSLTFMVTHLTISQSKEFREISLNDLSAFANAGKNWVVTSGFSGDYSKPWDLKKIVSGNGMVINDKTDKHLSHLVTKEEFGDIEIELDFMMDKESNSGVYLQGRYEIQLFDSWLKPNPAFSDCGGIYQRWDETLMEKGYEGMAPLANASRAPGLWQSLKIRFQAPRFDAHGKKTDNARFKEVYLNGILVQQQVEVSGPTTSSAFMDEKPMGPLVLQGDHGKVAFRNIRYRQLEQPVEPKGKRSIGAIIVKPDDRPYLLRSFIMFGEKKLNYTISMGSPQGLNYSFDLRQGAWLQVWRGGFMDATEMWHSRGESQLSKPLGSVVSFADNPSVAQLSDINSEWPDSLKFDDLQNEGYLLDNKGFPTFKYTINGTKIADKIFPSDDGTGLVRILKVDNPSENLFCRVVSAQKIEAVDKEKGLFRVDGVYYIRIDKYFKPYIRPSEQGQEMLVSLKNKENPLTYTVIW